MYDGGKIITGLVIFVAFLTYPFWTSKAAFQPKPEISKELQAANATCIESKEFMRKEHMQLLNDWRDSVVRTGNKIYTATDGKQYEMSLTKTCQKCHDKKDKFCDECHNNLSVKPYCWDCHVELKGAK